MPFFLFAFRETSQLAVDNLIYYNIGYQGNCLVHRDSAVWTRMVLLRQLGLVSMGRDIELRPTPFTLIQVHAHGPQNE
jgi:hypothetical protein